MDSGIVLPIANPETLNLTISLSEKRSRSRLKMLHNRRTQPCKRRVLPFVLALCLCALATESLEHTHPTANLQDPTSALSLWTVLAAVPVFEETTSADGGGRCIDWAAQRGEAEHAQLALRWSGPSPVNLTITVTSTIRTRAGMASAAGTRTIPTADAAPLPTAWLTARQVGQLYCNATFVSPPRGAGWYPDPLLPIKGMLLEPNRTAAVWLTVEVPVDARAGLYRSTVQVAAGGVSVGEVVVNLTVWNLTLPSIAESDFSTFFQFTYETAPFGARSKTDARGALEPYYGNSTDAVKAMFFELLCKGRAPPIGYQWLRPVADMVVPLDPSLCTGTVPPDTPLSATPDLGAPLNSHTSTGNTSSPILFSIMSISDLFGHVNPAPYNATYFAQLWKVLDPVVDALNSTGALPHAAVYGFDEAHPKTVYEPLVAQLFGEVKARYGGQLATIATLHYCPSLDAPIDVLVQSYASYPNGTSEPSPPGPSGQYCPAGFPAEWASASPRRRYFFYHCFSPRSPNDAVAPWEPKYGAMNTFVDYPRIHSRLLPWWAAVNEGVSGWLYFQVSEWRVFSGPPYPEPRPYQNHSQQMAVLPSFLRQPNDGFVEERVGGGESGGSRLTFNVNKYYGNVYGGGTTAGDGVLVYPGRQGPVSSARFESWRDGSEDLALFARLPPETRAELVHRLVQGVGEWTDDAALLEQSRREAAALLTHP